MPWTVFTSRECNWSVPASLRGVSPSQRTEGPPTSSPTARTSSSGANGFRSTGNSTRYRSAELDSIIERFTTTIPMPERIAALAEFVHHLPG